MGVRTTRDWCVRLARSEPAGSVLVYGALLLNVACTAVVLFLAESLTPRERAWLLLSALSAWLLLVIAGWARGSLPLAGVIIAICITIVAAVSTPSNQSRDVYSYAMYGRIVTEYHENPFSNYPVHFEGDPIRRQVGTMWQRTPDIYGPAFTAIMAGLAPVNGESTFRVRFSYQLVSAAAMGAILWLLWRRTRSALVLAFAGLHPLVAVSVVNGGHPDALVALGVLVGVLLAMDRRVVLAALALAFAIAINFTTITVAVAIGVWAWRRWSSRELFRFGAITLGLGALPYLFLGGWLENAHDHAKLISRQSVWRVVDSLTGLRDHIPNGTTLLVGVLMVVVLWRQTRGATPELAAAAAIVVFVVASPWVMPWYGFAALPVLALRKPNLLTWVIALDAALILVGDQFPSLTPAGVGGVPHQILQVWVPILALVACVVAVSRAPRESEATALPAPSALV
jgi:Glycosyltransferase family 87